MTSRETKAVQCLGFVDGQTGAIVPPIHPASTFERGADLGYPTGRAYARADNPGFEPAERVLTELEGGQASLLFASGMAAATAAFLSLDPGDHVVAPRDMYWALRSWLAGYATRWGLAVEFVAMDDLDAVRAALRPGKTRLVWVETPGNPLWTITDIEAVATLAHRAGAVLAVDSTAATPVFTRPIALGADLVMHSATKYLNGHSDLIAGTLTTARDDDLWRRIKAFRAHNGAIAGAFEAWLLMRGMRTLHVRARRQAETAMLLAERLSIDPRVARVLYPGLPGHPGHDIAKRQMTGGFGGMLSIRLRGGRAAAIATAAGMTVFLRATSLGGVESLVEHRASVEGPDTPVPDDLLRLSIGLESPEDLLADLDQALSSSGG
ncbi:MAG: aminotransferase class I/II-fold pyridoxal phosphate-dependent enzyme [Alphaproteobacteria bacterium]|nr:aminotransferase class I/II-fold pyridoxal phosphate-dependent enzyme [Alphaproteobacteria bacterium]